MAKMEGLEDAMGNIEEKERAQDGNADAPGDSARVNVGKVDHFFDKIGVAAIVLTGSLRVGDTIEIVSGEDTVRQRVDSMQIDRKEVSEASSGDSVGIKTDRKVARGSIVYRV